MVKNINSAFKKTVKTGLFFVGAAFLVSCGKEKAPLSIYSPGDTYFYKGAQLNAAGDTVKHYSLKLIVPESEADSGKTFSVGFNTGGGASHDIVWELTDEQNGETITSEREVAKSDRKVTLNLPNLGPLVFTKQMLPLVADLDMGKKSFVQVAAGKMDNENPETNLTGYTATLTYPGDTVVFLPDSVRVVAKHYNAESEAGKQKIVSKFLFNKDRGFIRMEFILQQKNRFVFNQVPPFPEPSAKADGNK